MTELKDIMKTSNTYLKAHMRFYILWQLVSILCLGVTIWGIYILLNQLKNVAFVFGI